MSDTSLLSQLISVHHDLTLDVDSMDDKAVAELKAKGFTFHDMTSNQAIVFGQLMDERQWNDLSAEIKQFIGRHSLNLREDGDLLRVVDLVTILLARKVYPYLTPMGRLHVQTSPSFSFDTKRIVGHANRLIELFKIYDIPKERVCIKIPSTPAGILACKQLESEGIRTLATCLFSVPQAVAAHQAGCLYVAPYFNELRVHFERDVWKEYNDIVHEHPMTPVVYSIVKAFQKLNSTTLVMPASIVNLAEVVALTRLSPNHLTISAGLLQDMAQPRTAVANKELEQHDNDVVLSCNYLHNGAEPLLEAIQANTETQRKLNDALQIFDDMERKTKAFLCERLL
ncbi:aldolase [Pisolithus marmoratus]|nr:aldolase [Pisolithus marmoratus]